MLQCSRQLAFRRCYFTCSVLQYQERSFQSVTKKPLKTKQKKWFQAKGGMKSKPKEMLDLSFGDDEKPDFVPNLKKRVVKTEEEMEDLRASLFEEPSNKGLIHVPPPKLFDDLTPEFCSQLTGEGPRSISKKFALDNVKSAFQYLEKRSYPLPESLTVAQWQQFWALTQKGP